jgi:deoxyinosine 3'endonuclease (endonuclease V)
MKSYKQALGASPAPFVTVTRVPVEEKKADKVKKGDEEEDATDEQHHEEVDETKLPPVHKEFLAKWKVEQRDMADLLLLEDQFDWKVDEQDESNTTLRKVAGMDISFVEGNERLACAALVILEFPSLKVLHSKLEMVELSYPYIPGYLAFREAPCLLKLLDEVKKDTPEFYPDLILCDGNGTLHYRGFGLACHIGVAAGLPTLGVAKKLLCVDGLRRYMIQEIRDSGVLAKGGDFHYLVGNSGRTWGAVMRSTDKSAVPVYVSSGHMISLETAIRIVKLCSVHRIPEPLRCADKLSRKYIRDEGL